MDSVKQYTELHKQLARKQKEPAIEVLFLVWSYLSVKSMPALPHRMTIRKWSDTVYVSGSASVDLKTLFIDIDRHLPFLKGTFSSLYDYYVARYPQEEANSEWELYASVFSRFSYEDIKQAEWQSLFDMVIDEILRKNKQLNADPIDISKLAASVFAGQFSLNAVKSKGAKVVFIPSISAGVLAVALNEKIFTNKKFIGSENNLECYSLAIFSFVINGIDTTEIKYGESGDFKSQQWDYFISFFKPSWLDNVDELNKIFRIITINSEIAIVVIRQNFLFSNKFSLIRRHLLYDGNLSAIISLAPSNSGISRVKSALLVFNKRAPRDKVLLVNAENIGVAGKRVVKYEEEDINYISKIVTEGIEHDGVSKMLDVIDLRSFNYSLQVSNRLPEGKNNFNLKEIKKRIKMNREKLIGHELNIQNIFEKKDL